MDKEEEVQAKDIENTFNKVTEIFPNLEEGMVIQIQVSFSTQNKK
jgi:hypothetical protein